jgi:hypothetical protein
MMRSELVFGATAYVPNRFLLSGLAAKAIRNFHKPNTRIADTTNDVFVRFSRDNPVAAVPRTDNVQPLPAAAQDESNPLWAMGSNPWLEAGIGDSHFQRM